MITETDLDTAWAAFSQPPRLLARADTSLRECLRAALEAYEAARPATYGDEIARAVLDWMDARSILPDVEEDGSIDIGEVLQALDNHEHELLASKPATQGESVAVPEGWRLVPECMTLTKEAVASLAFQLGGDLDSEDADDHWCAGVLWIGETEGDHGEKYYGLNVSNMECLEEGSIPIVEFAAPQPPAVELLPQSSAPPALYQHDDGRYALAIGDVARHRLTHGEPGWHRVPLDVVVTNTGIEE